MRNMNFKQTVIACVAALLPGAALSVFLALAPTPALADGCNGCVFAGSCYSEGYCLSGGVYPQTCWYDGDYDDYFWDKGCGGTED